MRGGGIIKEKNIRIKEMRTIQEIKNYILEHKTVSSAWESNIEKSLSKADKHIEYVLVNLKKDEEVQFAFLTNGVYSGSRTVMGGLGILLITNDRILYGQKAPLLLGGDQIKSINFDNAVDVTSSNFGILNGRITIDTRTETCSFDVVRKRTSEVAALVNSVVQEILEAKKTEKNGPTIIQNQASAADELLKMKQLLDAGIISQEEFDAKKKQLLGL